MLGITQTDVTRSIVWRHACLPAWSHCYGVLGTCCGLPHSASGAISSSRLHDSWGVEWSRAWTPIGLLYEQFYIIGAMLRTTLIENRSNAEHHIAVLGTTAKDPWPQAATSWGLIERASRGVSCSLLCSAFHAHTHYDFISIGNSMVETNNLDRTKSKHLTTRVSFAFTGLSAPYLGRILGFGSTPPIIANLCLGLSKPIRATRLGNLPLCGSPGGGGFMGTLREQGRIGLLGWP